MKINYKKEYKDYYDYMKRNKSDKTSIFHNSPEAFEKMDKKDKDQLLKLIELGLFKTKYVNKKKGSYGLKHVFEKYMTCRYVGNGELKGAMLYSGYTAYGVDNINWDFNFHESSPIIKAYKYKQGIGIYTNDSVFIRLKKVDKIIDSVKIFIFEDKFENFSLPELENSLIGLNKLKSDLQKEINKIFSDIDTDVDQIMFGDTYNEDD